MSVVIAAAAIAACAAVVATPVAGTTAGIHVVVIAP